MRQALDRSAPPPAAFGEKLTAFSEAMAMYDDDGGQKRSRAAAAGENCRGRRASKVQPTSARNEAHEALRTTRPQPEATMPGGRDQGRVDEALGMWHVRAPPARR